MHSDCDFKQIDFHIDKKEEIRRICIGYNNLSTSRSMALMEAEFGNFVVKG